MWRKRISSDYFLTFPENVTFQGKVRISLDDFLTFPGNVTFQGNVRISSGFQYAPL